MAFSQGFPSRAERIEPVWPDDLQCRELTNPDPEDWNRFAERTDASYQVRLDHLRAEALKSRRRLILLEVCERDGESWSRIAQCAAFKRGCDFEIQDGLQMAERHAAQWPHAMHLVLRRLGPGTYLYGGPWSCEPPRQETFETLAGVTISAVQSLTIQAVDFRNWPSWDRYWAKVSENTRRNVRYALERVPGLRVERFAGVAALRALPTLIRLQEQSLSRKNVSFSALKLAFRTLFRVLLCPENTEILLARGEHDTLAAVYGVQMGGRFYYIAGGHQAGASGANWYLMQQMACMAHERAPQGRLVMGNVDYATHEEDVGGGLLRARRSLRVTDYPTEIVTFTYA